MDDSIVTSSRRFYGGVDIHSHPLPGIDDGSTSMDNSLSMLLLAARYGTTVMVATPHRYYGGGENGPDLLRRLTGTVNEALARTRFGRRIRLLVGQEIPLTLTTAAELHRGDVLTIGDQRVYALVEPPFDHLPEWMPEAVAAVRAVGIRPVLAHPERNAIVQQDPERALALAEAGALFQLTAMSVSGANGRRALEASHWLLDRGRVAVIASDSHSPDWRPPTMRAAYHALVDRYGLAVARTLCIDNPRRIVEGQTL